MKQLKIGIIGVGRLGHYHAANLAFKVPEADLVAICDANQEAANKIAQELDVAKVYSDPEEMCADPEIEAVAIVTNTASHVEMIRIAMQAGKHVFCEKPLAETVEKCQEAEGIIAAHPNLTFMLGFMRRFDNSYQIAKRKVDAGEIGNIVMMRCYSMDPRATIEGTIEYGPRSGGNFIDMNIHDYDLIRWFVGSEPKKIWSIGGCYEFKEFAEWDDGDNVASMIQCENDVMAFVMAGRAAAHGSHVETEIIGTKGMLRVAPVPADSMVQIYDEHGVRQECYQDFLPRWRDAYINMMSVFCRHVLDGTKASPTALDGTMSTRIAFAATESFQKNELLNLD